MLAFTSYQESPKTLQIEIGSKCNLVCTHCPLTQGTTLSSLNRGSISEPLWQKILSSLSEAGSVILTGFGEPLLNPTFFDMLLDLESRNILYGFSTNGILLKKDLALKLTTLKKLQHINFSIDSPNAAIYRSMRGGELEKALSGIRTLIEETSFQGQVSVSGVITQQNIESLLAFPKLLKKLKVSNLFLQSLVDRNFSSPESGHLFFNSENLAVLHRIREQAVAEGITLNFSLPVRLDQELSSPDRARSSYFRIPTENQETRTCTVPWELPYIDKDGRVFPCCNSAGNEEHSMGSLENATMDEIWSGKKINEFRNGLVQGGKLVPRSCQTCTSVPIGTHPFNQYALEIDFENSRIISNTAVEIKVINRGAQSWTKETRLHIGRTRPRDAHSLYALPEWIGANRITSFREEIVPPQGEATFHFSIKQLAEEHEEVFQFLVEDVAWLPGTAFTLRSKCGVTYLGALKRAIEACKSLMNRSLSNDIEF